MVKLRWRTPSNCAYLAPDWVVNLLGVKAILSLHRTCPEHRKGGKNILRLIIICLLGLTLLTPMANAEEKPINIISCRSGTNTMLTASKDLVIFSYDTKF